MIFPFLFEGGRIGRCETKNRIAMPAFHLGMAKDGRAGQELVSLYERIARGGAGVITVGVCNTWRSDELPLSGALDLSDDRYIESMSVLADRIKTNGAVAGVQLSPLAGYNNPNWCPDPYSLADIIRGIGDAAGRAERCGFDFVELMLSGGSLLSHILSPVLGNWNLPGYTGDLQERLRAPVEAIASIRRATDDRIPVSARIHGHEFLDGGYGLEGACSIACALRDAGVAAINVTGGGHRTNVPQLTDQGPPLAFVYYAAQVRRAVDLPVMAGSRISDPNEAEAARRIGVDFVNVARALFVDPDWPTKALERRSDEIMHCMRCGVCLDRVVARKPARCSLDPVPRTEARTLSGLVRRVLVVGAGPAGVQAAWDLRRMGHDVTIQDRSSKPGGRWRLASTLHGRGGLGVACNDFLERAIRSGVKIETGVEVTPETARSFGADLIVLATGAIPRRPDISFLERHPNVIFADEAVSRPESAGRTVAIIGAGGVGVEIAIHMAGVGEPDLSTLGFIARYGNSKWLDDALKMRSNREVTLLRRRGFAGKGLGRSVRWALMRDLERLGIRLIERCEYKEASAKGLYILDRRIDEPIFIEADTIVIAAGYEPDRSIGERFRGAAPQIVAVGDVSKVGNIGSAIAAAHRTVVDLWSV